MEENSMTMTMTMEEAIRKGGCDKLQRSLIDCHRRVPFGQARQSACRHLNQAFANCIVAVICPCESQAVESLCSSAGTALKRSQCQQAQFSLSLCLSNHQHHHHHSS